MLSKLRLGLLSRKQATPFPPKTLLPEASGIDYVEAQEINEIVKEGSDVLEVSLNGRVIASLPLAKLGKGLHIENTKELRVIFLGKH